jgi:hypothetical protein
MHILQMRIQLPLVLSLYSCISLRGMQTLFSKQTSQYLLNLKSKPITHTTFGLHQIGSPYTHKKAKINICGKVYYIKKYKEFWDRSFRIVIGYGLKNRDRFQTAEIFLFATGSRPASGAHGAPLAWDSLPGNKVGGSNMKVCLCILLRLNMGEAMCSLFTGVHAVVLKHRGDFTLAHAVSLMKGDVLVCAYAPR